MASLSGLYALDALDGDLLERFEAFLATHPETRAEVDEFRATAAALADLPAAEPPAGLRDRVLAEVAGTRQDAPVVDLAARRNRRGRTWLSIAAAILLIAAIGGLVGRAVAGPSASTNQLADVLGRPDARVVSLAGAPASGAKVVWSASAGAAVFVANRVDAVPGTRTYELWQLHGGRATRVGLFRPDSHGRVRSTFTVDLAGADGVGVTVEPDGGSDTPTLPVVLSGALS